MGPENGAIRSSCPGSALLRNQIYWQKLRFFAHVPLQRNPLPPDSGSHLPQQNGVLVGQQGSGPPPPLPLSPLAIKPNIRLTKQSLQKLKGSGRHCPTQRAQAAAPCLHASKQC